MRLVNTETKGQWGVFVIHIACESHRNSSKSCFGQYASVSIKDRVFNASSCRTKLNSPLFHQRKMHVVTIGTDMNKMTKLYESAAKHNKAIKNWGFGLKWKGTDMTGPGGGKVNTKKTSVFTTATAVTMQIKLL